MLRISLDELVGSLIVNEGVFKPNEGSIALARTSVQYDGEFLDMGTGTGFISVFLYLHGKLGDATDISAPALECAHDNFRRFQVHSNLFKSNLYERVDRQYDTIIFNPPTSLNETENDRMLKNSLKSILPQEIVQYLGGWYQHWNAQKRRISLVTFINETRNYLRIGGRLLLNVLNTDVGYLQENSHKCLVISKETCLRTTVLEINYI